MTCIVGVISGERVVIGADSCGASSYDMTIRKDAKVFTVDEFIIGGTDSFRMLQLLQFHLDVPTRCPDMGHFEYMVRCFVPAVRTCLKDGGFASKTSEAESGGQFIVGYQGHLYKIYSDYQVEESVDPFAACGCGEKYALGALHVLYQQYTGRPAYCVNLALATAEKFSCGVRGPFNVISSGEDLSE